jgi:hypothetical protein
MTAEELIAITPLIAALAVIAIFLVRVLRFRVGEGGDGVGRGLHQEFKEEVTRLRLLRDAIRGMIARVYELADRGVIDVETKDRLASRLSGELARVEERLGIYERYEEFFKLVEERERVRREYEERIRGLDEKISRLRAELGIGEETKAGEVAGGGDEEFQRVIEEVMRLLREAGEPPSDTQSSHRHPQRP